METTFRCPQCAKRYKVPDSMAGKTVVCPNCRNSIKLPHKPIEPVATDERVVARPNGPTPSETPSVAGLKPRPEPSLVRSSRPQSLPTDSSTAEPTTEKAVVHPWDIPPQMMAKAAAYRESGQVRSYLCKVDEFLESILKSEVFASIKRKAKQEANLAEYHVYPDLVGIVQRPEPAGCLIGLLASFLPLQLVLFIIGLFGNLIGLAVLGVVALIIVAALWSVFGFFGLLVCLALLIGVSIGGMKLYEYSSAKRIEHIAARVRKNPKSPYGVKQMFKRAGWVRWRTGIGHGQTGAAMAERYWQSGDVEQFVRMDVQHRLRKRNLLLVIMDRPMTKEHGISRIALTIWIRRFFGPRRRIYVVDFEGGAQAADEAAQASSQVLGVPVGTAKFSFNLLKISSR